MEEKTLKFSAIVLLLLTIVTCVTLPYFPKIRVQREEAKEAQVAEEEYEAGQVEMNDLAIVNTGGGTGSYGGKLSLRLPDGVSEEDIHFINDYVTQTIQITIPGTDEAYFASHPVTGSSNHIDSLSYVQKGEQGLIEIVMDRVYEINTGYENGSFYFDFLTPHEVYDKVVVIDAGHGGRAPGATKQGVNEKDIDLAIVLQLKKILEEQGQNIGVYYTRTDDSNPTFDQRVQLANKSDADLFISIHNNSTGNGRMSSASGTAVMYDESDETGMSQKLAEICAKEVTDEIGSRNRGIIEGDSIYIIRTSDVPVALIEVGFMTNKEELRRLCSEDYQEKTATGIYKAILQAFEEGF